MAITKQKRTRLLSRLIAIFMIMASLAVFIPLILHFGSTLTPVKISAVQGEVFLQENDFLVNNKVALIDGWRFFDNRLVQPEDVKDLEHESRFVRGKGGWQLDTADGNKENGSGTYHLTVYLPQNKPDLAMQIPQIETAYKLFINGELVAKGGQVAETKLNSAAEYNAQIVLIPNVQDSFTLTIQVSSFDTAWGGLWTPIIIGNANDIYAAKRDLVALSMFSLGVLTITAIFYLIQFYLRPSEKIPLVFGCFCLLLFFRELTYEHMLFVLQLIGVGFATYTKINYLTFYLGMPAALYFLQLFFPQVFHSKITKGCYIISGLFSLFVVFSPTLYIGLTLVSYQVFCLVVASYILYCLVIANIKKQPSAKIMMLGSLILSVFTINEVLFIMDVINTGRFESLGIVGFIICQSYVINNYFNNVRIKNEALSAQLIQSNEELQELGIELESKVEQRTKELEQANLELQTLAEIDNLTGALNRHGMQKYLQTALERLRRSREPSCIVLFDFDNFKNINDSYGHDSGDKILVSAVNIMSGLIREQDKLSRWGGEEFLLLLPDTEISGAIAIAEKLRIIIAEKLSNTIASEVPITITGGVAAFKHDEIFEILFKRADNALYKGKRMGRNRIHS